MKAFEMRDYCKIGRVRACAEFDSVPCGGSIVDTGRRNPDGSACSVIGVRTAICAALRKGGGAPDLRKPRHIFIG